MWEKETVFHHERKFFHNYFLIKNTRKWEWYIIFVFYPNIWEKMVVKLIFPLFLKPVYFIFWQSNQMKSWDRAIIVAGIFVNVSLGSLWNCTRFYFMGILTGVRVNIIHYNMEGEISLLMYPRERIFKVWQWLKCL